MGMLEIFRISGRIAVEYSDAQRGIEAVSRSADSTAESIESLGDSADEAQESIEGLSNEEVGLRTDKTEGLILDYFEESLIVDEDMVVDREIELKAEPVDPIRKVVVVKDDSTEYILVENIDYTVNEKTIILNIINFDGESPIIEVNDTVKVVYTPNLDDSSITLGYYAKRSNTDNNVEIQPNYIEYKS